MDEISIKFTSKCAENGSTILSSFPFSSGDNITPLLIELGQVRLNWELGSLAGLGHHRCRPCCVYIKY